jgi:ribonucleoside-diphosphate reductase alpha chain
LLTPLAEFVWETRYRSRTRSGVELSIAQTWSRVAQAVAGTEPDPSIWSQTFQALMKNFQFLPGGRILAGAGAGRDVTLCNCFVMGLIEDSIPGIFDALKEGALTMRQGGGVGYDFSTLRPYGYPARGSVAAASGPVSFMRVWDSTCATMTSTGARRGAMMATLRCDHPDIESFIEAKREPGALEHFNLSVLVTDAFMRAVDAGAQWQLVFPDRALDESPAGSTASRSRRIERVWSGGTKPIPCRVLRTVPARWLWEKLCASAHATAEPGVLFVDRLNAQNNLGYRETLSATNPCGEVPLPPYGACTLGSINLAAFIRQPFSREAVMDLERIGVTAGLAVRFLDDVIEIAHFPLKSQREEALATRRIGLGITGLADALVMLGLRYDSEAAREYAAQMLRTVMESAYSASIELARVKGCFPDFDRALYLERPFIRALPQTLRDGIARYGIRNGHLIAIAPTGSISLLAGNVSSGIEPIFCLEGKRRVRLADGQEKFFDVVDYALASWRATGWSGGQPDAFMEANQIAPLDHLLMQAALQPFVDASISKTIALEANATPDAVERSYTRAYQLGLKGCTVYREGSRTPIVGSDRCCAAPRVLAN